MCTCTLSCIHEDRLISHVSGKSQEQGCTYTATLILCMVGIMCTQHTCTHMPSLNATLIETEENSGRMHKK